MDKGPKTGKSTHSPGTSDDVIGPLVVPRPSSVPTGFAFEIKYLHNSGNTIINKQTTNRKANVHTRSPCQITSSYDSQRHVLLLVASSLLFLVRTLYPCTPSSFSFCSHCSSACSLSFHSITIIIIIPRGSTSSAYKTRRCRKEAAKQTCQYESGVGIYFLIWKSIRTDEQNN